MQFLQTGPEAGEDYPFVSTERPMVPALNVETQLPPRSNDELRQLRFR